MSKQESLVPDVAVSRSLPTIAHAASKHLLIIHVKGFDLEKVVGADIRDGARNRLPKKAATPGAAVSAAVMADVAGKLVVWAEYDAEASAFSRLTALRNAVELLLKEQPRDVGVLVHGKGAAADLCAADAVYAIAVNGQFNLGKQGGPKSPAPAPLRTIHVHGVGRAFDGRRARAIAEGNLLARLLTLRPPNDLTPKRFRADVTRLAKAEGWRCRTYDFKVLKKMGAGAFCAVAQGSPHQDAAIIHLSYAPKRLKKGTKAIALIGKGICMDTGGHGLKTAKGMYGMHEDMNGAAVALGILKAVSDMKLPIAVDVWLAIAQNHIGPEAYQPGDVVTALDGTTIEVVHTDAEGRMVLADTLTLAAREQPALMVDFATLTGAMVNALGTRMAGIFSNRPDFATLAVECGRASGERVSEFPLESDYDAALDSKLADIKQCLISGEADAIYAARFLSRFTDDLPWIHMDLSAHRHDGGLGAVSGEVTGFGVAWGVELLERQVNRR
jgi:leucyl aminopeptidase